MDKSFVEKVGHMRRLQVEYFRHRDHMTLAACKKAEKEVDQLIESFSGKKVTKSNDDYPKLF